MILAALWGATIEGRVFDKDMHEPLSGCSVYLEGTSHGATTGRSGHYRITDVPEGSYTLIFAMIGYETVTRRVTVAEPTVSLRESAALASSPITLPAVEVTSRRSEFEQEVTTSAFRMDKEVLMYSPVMLERDLFRTLMSLPGVTFVSDFVSALYVRGGSPDQNLILLDKMVLYNPFHLGGFLSTFMVDAVGGIEFLTGGFPASYGNRLSAVLDVESAEFKPFAGAYLSTSLLATEGAAWGRLGEFSGLLTARRTYFDKVVPLLFDFEFPYYFYDVHAVAGWQPSSHTRLGATYFQTRDRLDLSDQDIPLEFGWGNQLACLRLVQDVGERWALKAWLGWSRYTAEFDFSDFVEEADTIDDFSLRTVLIRPGEKFSVEIGGEATYYRFIYRADFEPFAVYHIDGRPEGGGVFFSWKCKPSRRFLMQLGTRFSAYHAVYPDTLRDTVTDQVTGVDTLIRFDLEPQARASVKYFLSDDDALSFCAGNFYQNLGMLLPEGGRMPTNFWIPVFGEYEPQQAVHFILGYEHLYEDGSRIRVEPYYKHYLYLLAFNEALDISDVDRNMFAPGAGRAWGVDFSAEKASGRLTGWVSYSLAFSRFISDTLEFYTNFDRRHSLNVVASYRFKRNWRANAHWTFASGMPYAGTMGRYRMWYWDAVYQEWRYYWMTIEAERNTLRFPAYHRLDIGASKTWNLRWADLTVRADIINLYNHKNVLLYYYDMESEPPVQKRVTMIPFFPSLGIELRF